MALIDGDCTFRCQYQEVTVMHVLFDSLVPYFEWAFDFKWQLSMAPATHKPIRWSYNEWSLSQNEKATFSVVKSLCLFNS